MAAVIIHDGNSHPSAVPHTNDNKSIEVPYNASLIIVCSVAFLSPLLYHVYNSINHTNDYSHRYLQIECGITNYNSTTTESSTEILLTWDAIRSTLFIAASVAVLCLLGYECFRRDPIVGKYVYDRKRLTQPGRSPPPLMLSRSLWHGYPNDDEESANTDNKSTCCEVRPSLFEFIFLNLDKLYLRYSRAANEARKERERRGYYNCCRTGCYHNCCCNNHGQRLIKAFPDVHLTVDEDGYAFYPGFKDDYSHAYQPSNERHNSVEESEVDAQMSPNWRKTIADLFPEDHEYKEGEEQSPLVSLQADPGNSLSDVAEEEEEFKSQSRHASEDQSNSLSNAPLEHDSADLSTTHIDSEIKDVDGSGSRTAESLEPDKSVEGNENDDAEETSEETDALLGDTADISCETSNDVCNNEGEDTQLPENIHSKPYADPIASEETKEELSDEIPELNLVNNESINNEEELNNSLSGHNNLKSDSPVLKENRFIDKEDESTTNDVEADLKYPYRLKYLFMPPGFHTWGNFIKFLLSFFFLQDCITKCCRQLASKLPTSPQNNNENSRRLSVPTENPGKILTEGEQELLKCAGLDTYLLIRLARFGFDVTCYPFMASLICILPIYYTSHEATQSTDNTSQDGFLTLTINSIPDDSLLIVWIVVFTIILYFYIMRRLWIEWEFFITLRHKFLAVGGLSDKPLPYRRKYSNSVMVDCVPKSLRSDTNLQDCFESLFPGQIESAEMMIDTSHLETTLQHRLKLIEKFDAIDAKYRYECWRYEMWEKEGKSIGCRRSISKPMKPKIRSAGLFSEKNVDALDYYTNKINEANTLADQEYYNIVQTRMKWSKKSLLQSLKEEEESNNPSQFAAQKLYSLFIPSTVRKFFGEDSEFFSGTGIVTFKSIASKQHAVQCNLSGTPYWMLTQDAPDPRDVFWANVCVERTTLESRKILVESLLLIGILGWGALVTVIQSWTYTIFDEIGLSETFFYGYLPVYVISLILLWLPNIFFLLAMRVIRFKSHKRCDEFVLLWNTGYRLANIFFTFFSITLFQALQCLRDDPDKFLQTLAFGIIRQSSFLMNLIILATGQETMLQLLQWRSLIKQALYRPLINLNAKSRRFIDWLNAPPEFERAFIFGFYAPVLSYALMIAIVYSFMAPVMLGATGIFFWVATKVHTHNALFVYCQRCEGGGKIFYYWSRIVFITLYSSIVIFSSILAIKKHPVMGVIFLFIMIIITYSIDKSVENTFVINSLHLPISIARIHDEEEKVALLEESNSTTSDGGEKFMYRHPILNQENWNCKPFWNFR